mmetsp:Transcript_48797/g.123774  ORF Transcript_48797/g.123774 Transcript_48797/m.123774 type:complete len:273 (-) Transcript_48797:322-1140(-)
MSPAGQAQRVRDTRRVAKGAEREDASDGRADQRSQEGFVQHCQPAQVDSVPSRCGRVCDCLQIAAENARTGQHRPTQDERHAGGAPRPTCRRAHWGDLRRRPLASHEHTCDNTRQVGAEPKLCGLVKMPKRPPDVRWLPHHVHRHHEVKAQRTTHDPTNATKRRNPPRRGKPGVQRAEGGGGHEEERRGDVELELEADGPGLTQARHCLRAAPAWEVVEDEEVGEPLRVRTRNRAPTNRIRHHGQEHRGQKRRKDAEEAAHEELAQCGTPVL